MKIAVASGKGGTGKTTLSVALALSAEQPLLLLDCDVEEPNCHLFLGIEEEEIRDVFVPVPEIASSKCENCGLCAQFCKFNAIASLGVRTIVFPELCHSCGGCTKICPNGAISEKNRLIGSIRSGRQGELSFSSGTLEIGHPMSPPLIKEVLRLSEGRKLVIIDSPPGTSCPMVAAVSQADFVILVSEPTPFGLHDLKLAVKMVREIRKPHCVVINRHGSGDERVEKYCADEGIEVALKIPDDRRIAVAYSQGRSILDVVPEMRSRLQRLLADKISWIESKKITV